MPPYGGKPLVIRPDNAPVGVSLAGGHVGGLMASVLSPGGVQLTALGIFGEYLGRIYREAKRIQREPLAR